MVNMKKVKIQGKEYDMEEKDALFIIILQELRYSIDRLNTSFTMKNG